MPIIIRTTYDMFEFEPAIDYYVNLVNLKGVSGIGLALEMRQRCPSHIDIYQAACRSGELRMGTVKVIENLEQHWGMILFPSKDHYANESTVEDISRGLEALRDLLKQDQYKRATIGMPIPGSGYGGKSYTEIYPLIIDCLGDLEATVFLSLHPEKTEMRPRYLVVAGSSDYGKEEKEKTTIDWVIDKSLEKWGTTLESYEGIVSGGCPGVDEYIAGLDFNKNYENTYCFRKTGKPPLVIKPNTHHNGVMADRQRDVVLCEIGHDIILIKPDGKDNNRLSSMQLYLENENGSRINKGLELRRVGIFGDRSTDMRKNRDMIPVHTSDSWEE